MGRESEQPGAARPGDTPRLRFDVLTLFPGLFGGFLGESIVKRAIDAGLVEVRLWNIRDWAVGKHQQVDDRPFGGGPGMVLMAPPVVDAVESVRSQGPCPGRLLFLSPRGQPFDQKWARELAGETRIILVCGRYEGFDERALEVLKPEELSIGDYVLCGGEVPAMVVIEAVSRLVPGVLGDAESPMDESFSDEALTLEYPHYTRPRIYRGLEVPEVLLSGDHAAIAGWRRSMRRGRAVDEYTSNYDKTHPNRDIPHSAAPES